MPDEPVSDSPTDPRSSDASGSEGESASEEQLRCDFCGEPSPNVRRIALDRDYDRLQTKHQVQYACDACSDRKEQDRLGLSR